MNLKDKRAKKSILIQDFDTRVWWGIDVHRDVVNVFAFAWIRSEIERKNYFQACYIFVCYSAPYEYILLLNLCRDGVWI